jgi:integrase
MVQAPKGLLQRAALLTLATSGLRRAELLSLDWSAVELWGRRLCVLGKGDKQREVPIFEELLPVLYALHAQAGFPVVKPVLCGRAGRPLQQSSLQAWLNRWLQGASLRDHTTHEGRNRYSLHSLRRFAAKQWLSAGLNIRQVRLLLGHEDLQTTMLYLNYDFEELHRAARSVDFGLALRPVVKR